MVIRLILLLLTYELSPLYNIDFLVLVLNSMYCNLIVGHGRSDGPRIHVNYIDEYVEDVLIHAHLMQREYPDLTTFAIGHSMVILHL